MDKCSVLVSSCDKYAEAWVPFFTLMGKYWKDRPYPVYLNTETKKVDKIANICVTTMNSPNKNLTWSGRLLNVLKQIDSEYVIFLLEDFFIMDTVDQAEIEHCIDLMDKNKNVANINFGYGKNIESTDYIDLNYAKRSRNTDYYLNAQGALWRRKMLIKLLSPLENAWQFEVFGSERAKLYKYDFVIKKDDILLFEYRTQICFNLGIQKGMWMQGNVDFFQKEGIEPPNWDNLGFYSQDKVNKTLISPPKRTFKEKWMRFLYASESVPRWEICDQFKLLFTHPKEFARQKYYGIKK